MKLSIIVPCFNERAGVAQLRQALEETRRALAPRYDCTLMLVDDGSTDGTGEALTAWAQADPQVRVVRHAHNRGLGAALRSGFAHATGELIATTDSDCTYNPRELGAMLERLTDDVDVVVASPYHPAGAVHNVPRYRLWLSRNLSRLYNRVLGTQLYTYTSLCRVYRRQVIESIRFESNGFLSMAEILVAALRQGYRVAEYPARLTVRRYGNSKAVILQLIGDHARFLGRLLRARVRTPACAAPASLPAGHHDLAAWNRALNRSHGMAVLERHPNALVQAHERTRKQGILRLVPVQPAGVIAEIGCESGGLSAPLAARCRYLVCVDIDHDAVVRARERMGSRRLGFVVADAQRLPFRAGWADVSVSACTLGHLPDPAAGLRELVRITRADGRLVINVPNDRWLMRLKHVVFNVLRLRRWFPGIHPGLAPGHLWAFHLGLLKQLCRGYARLERVACNPPYFTNWFVAATPVVQRWHVSHNARESLHETADSLTT